MYNFTDKQVYLAAWQRLTQMGITFFCNPAQLTISIPNDQDFDLFDIVRFEQEYVK